MRATVDILLPAAGGSLRAPARLGAPVSDSDAFSGLLAELAAAATAIPLLPVPASLPSQPPLEGALTNAQRMSASVPNPAMRSEESLDALPAAAGSDVSRRRAMSDGTALPDEPRVTSPAPARAPSATPPTGAEQRASVAVPGERLDPGGADPRHGTAGAASQTPAIPAHGPHTAPATPLPPRRRASAEGRPAGTQTRETPRHAMPEWAEITPHTRRVESAMERADARPTEPPAFRVPVSESPAHVSIEPGRATGTPNLPAASAPAEVAVPARVQWLASKGGGSARIVLHPAELGEVEISVRVRGNAVDVSITTEEPLARALLQNASDRFGEALAGRELRIESLEIRVTGARGAGLGDPGTGSGSATGHEGASAQSDQHPAPDRDPGRRPAVPEPSAAAQSDARRSAAAHLDLHI